MQPAEQLDESVVAPASNNDPVAAQHYELIAFQDEVLLAVARLKSNGETPSGTVIKTRIEDAVNERINHSQLYHNIDQLANKN